jgi:hypothetical protein
MNAESRNQNRGSTPIRNARISFYHSATAIATGQHPIPGSFPAKAAFCWDEFRHERLFAVTAPRRAHRWASLSHLLSLATAI